MIDLVHHRAGFLAPPDLGGDKLETDLWVHRPGGNVVYWIAETTEDQRAWFDNFTVESSKDAIISQKPTFPEALAELEDWLKKEAAP